MDITSYIDEFITRSRYKDYKAIVKPFFCGDKNFSLNMQPGYEESEYLPDNIKACVKSYTRDKDKAIAMFEDFIDYLQNKGVDVNVDFPPVPIANSFERQMFIAKYLQDKDSKVSDLSGILWVSDRTVEQDLSRLRGDTTDPIQVCGKQFKIDEMHRENGQVYFSSTAHPVFLTENLTQIIVMLKGLKIMAENPLYKTYAEQTASEIWIQLSRYAKRRIKFVLSEIMPEELEWYESLEENDGQSFHTEKHCSKITNEGPSVLIDCLKNEGSFCVEYETDGHTEIYTDCSIIKNTYISDPLSVEVDCSNGRTRLLFEKVIRSAYLPEELLAN